MSLQLGANFVIENSFLNPYVQLEIICYTIKMVGTYGCPKCKGTEVTWDRGIRKAVCPKDRILVNDYEIVLDVEK